MNGATVTIATVVTVRLTASVLLLLLFTRKYVKFSKGGSARCMKSYSGLGLCSRRSKVLVLVLVLTPGRGSIVCVAK